MRYVVLSALGVFFAVGVHAQDNGEEERVNMHAQHEEVRGGVVFPRGEKNEAFAAYFTGTSYLQPLTTGQMSIANVTFEPGCRNFWHIHRKGGQILLVTGGRGWYQEWGKPARALAAGDVVDISPEVKHWHGAAKNSWFVHLSVGVPAEGASNEWLEPVSDEEYGKLE